ncbi:MAG: methyl-accepting chemotaxis protein [Xenococcaceae cyanobacterium]
MVQPIKKSLLSKLVTYFSLLSLVTVSIVAITAYILSRNALKQSVFERLTVAVSIKDYEINQWFNTQRQDVLLSAQLPEVQTQAKVLLRRKASEKQSEEYQLAYKNISQYFSDLAAIKPNLRETSILTTGGIVVFSTNKTLEGKYQPIGATTTYFTADQTDFKPTFYTSPITGKTAITFATPILDRSGNRIGVLSINLDLKEVDDLIRERTGLGESGQTYLVGRLERKNAFISSEQSDIKKYPEGVSSLGIDAATEEKNGAGLYPNYDGVPVVGVYRWLDKQNLALLAEISQQEAFAPARQLARNILLVGLGSSALLLIGVYLLSRQITKPIKAITNAAIQVTGGSLNHKAPVLSEDEIGVLAQAFNQMADQTQRLLGQQEEAARQQMAAQTAIARQQTESAEREREQKEALQGQLSQLLKDVEEASKGDLTVRAEIAPGEMGIVADFFNFIIENLRDLVTQVKQAAFQVNTSVGENESAIRQLAESAIKQATQIGQTLNSVEEMTRSIQEVADNARAAAEVAHVASAKAQTGGEAMDRTVQSILHLRETVASTAKKVKRLGESSQQISQVISMIKEIALKTNLLAINASIEAAHAGEEGQGFAVVAEEVGELAEQSAAATKEIEQIVANIQLGTSEVVQAMEVGTGQVVEGTSLVEEAKQSLGQIVDVSGQIDQLLQSISSATVSQVQTSQGVTKLMEQIAQISESTSDSSGKVSSSLQQTVEIAEQLQASVGKFKVREQQVMDTV